jgi:type I restriction enzyme S subunit
MISVISFPNWKSATVKPIDINPRDLETVRSILSRHVPDREVRAFGSRVTWTAKEFSDLDLSVMGEVPLPRSILAELEEDFRESNLPFKVDVVDWATTKENFRRIIEKENVVVQEEGRKKRGMAGEWKTLPFSEAVSVNPRVELKRGQDYPFVDMQAINPSSRCAYSNELRVFEGSGSRFVAGDTLMARITPCLENGKIARFCAEPGAMAHGSTEFITIRGRDGVTDTAFAYYLTKWEEVSGYAINQMTGTSGRQRVPTTALDHLSVPIPSLSEQRAIAHILGTLDDKIELNRRMNETLEGMARTIFKSWFVDFDPVRAKCRNTQGRGVGAVKESAGAIVRAIVGAIHESPLPGPIADLFPSEFQDSELGQIPKGWRVGAVGEEFNLTMGQSPPGETYNEIGDGTQFFQGRTDFGFRYPSKRVFCTSPTRFANPGDTLVSVRAPVGDINMALEKCCIGRGVAAIRHKSGSRSYTYYAMHSLVDAFRNFEAGGTVFGCINKDDFQRLRFIVPPTQLVLDYEKMAFPFDHAIENQILQSRTIAAIRNTLLPKLLSGEIRVKNAEKFMKVCV